MGADPAGAIAPAEGRRLAGAVGASAHAVVELGDTDPESLAESVLRGLPDLGMIVFDHDLRIVRLGGEEELRDAWVPGAAVGVNALDVLPQGASARVARQLVAALRGRAGTCESTSADGRRGFSVSVVPIRSAEGDVIAGAAVARAVNRSGRAPRPGAEMPARGPGIVPRRALLLRLADASHARVLLLTAPAGCGKTTVIAQWAEADGRPFAWVRATERDRDPAVLRASIRSALAGCDPPYVLVLDDAQHLASGPACAVIATVVDDLPDGAQLVIASRTELPLALGRLLAGNDLVRLGPRHLALSAAETASLLAANGVGIPAEDAEALNRHTDGWPVGVALAARAFADGALAAPDVAQPGGLDRILSDYLSDELLDPLLPPTLDFLLRTSVLERMSGSLCDAALEESGSGETLAALERSNMLIVPLDQGGEWYRLSPALRDLLRSRLRRGEPGAEAEIHARASHWWEARGDVEAAVHHARLAGDIARAAELVGRILPAYQLSGRTGLIARLLGEFSDDELCSSALLSTAMAWACLTTGPAEACHHWSAVAEGAAALPASGGVAEGAGPAFALLRAAVAAHGTAAMGTDAVLAASVTPPGSPWMALCRYYEGVAAELTGDRDHARSCLDDGLRLASIAAPALRASILAQLQLIARDENDGEQARRLAEDADAMLHEHGIEGHPDTAIVDAVWALMLAKDGHEAHARDRVRRAVQKLDARASAPWSEAQVRIALAHARLCLGDGPGARALEAQARRAVETGADDAVCLKEQLESLRLTLDAFPATTIPGAGHLTAAELRVLRHLPTHLSFREIGERLYLSRHTVKTEAISTYRKLGVNSRAEAVSQARELGIL
jgi:LuxR family maltose regulon positive regulatory protein